MTVQGPANGQDFEANPRAEARRGWPRRFLGGAELGRFRSRIATTHLPWRPKNDPAVRRVQDGAPTAAEPVDTSSQPPATDDAPAAEAVPGERRPGSSATSDELRRPAAARNDDLGAATAVSGTGGGAEAPETASPPEDRVKHLQEMLGYEDAAVKVYGWIQNSYTGNANGMPRNGENFGVNPNHLANAWQGNQYYMVFENPLEQSDEINFGFRVDLLFGNDWQFTFMQGFLNNAFKLNSFDGLDFPQFFGQVHLPILVKGGIDVKAGRGYTLTGYEQVPAIERPLLSVPYMFNYGQPFTHVGVITAMHVTDRINVYNGVTNGWDRWINQRYLWGYTGGFSWTSKDDKTSLTTIIQWGPNQFPSMLPANQQLYDDGYVNVPSLAGLPNPGYFRNDRTLFTTVATHKWNEKITQVVESDQGWERSIPGLGSGGRNGRPRSATWFSFGNWFLVDLSPKLTGVWRSEVFWDPQGARVLNKVNGDFVGDRYYEMTLGLIYKPIPNVWFRPEIRQDWTQFHKAYSDDTRKSQLTLGFDVILLW